MKLCYISANICVYSDRDACGKIRTCVLYIVNVNAFWSENIFKNRKKSTRLLIESASLWNPLIYVILIDATLFCW